MRPDESDDSDESVRAESAKGTDRSSAGSDGEDDDGGSGSDSAKSTTARKRRPAVGELAKDAPDLARQLQLVDKANAFKYMIAHGRTQEEEVSSDGSDDAVLPPARSHAAGRDRFSSARVRRRGWNTDCRSTTRQSRRRLAFRRRRNRPARQKGQLVGLGRSRRRGSASDDELTLDGSLRTPAAKGRVGPHAALSGLTQRTASAVFGTV